MIVCGTIGSAKSGTVKALLKRSRAVYPDRFVAVLDPKGEYTPLADWLGIPVVKLRPGGRHQLNPMEADGDGDPADALLARQGLATALVAGRAAAASSPRSRTPCCRGRSTSCRGAGRCSRSATSTSCWTTPDPTCCAWPGCQPVGDGQGPLRRPVRAGEAVRPHPARHVRRTDQRRRRLAARPRRRARPVRRPQRPRGAAAGDAGRHLLARRSDAPPGPPEAAGHRRGVGGGPSRRRLRPGVA